MKKISIIISFFFVLNGVKAQTGVPDTLAYLQTIVTNKAQYIGQPFSILSSGLQLQVKRFNPFADDHAYKNKETTTGFAFYFPNTMQDLYLIYPCLIIEWQTPLNAEISRQVWNDNGRGKWLPNSATLYNSAIISDIYILE